MRYRRFADSFVNQQGLQFRRIGRGFALGQGGDVTGEDRQMLLQVAGGGEVACGRFARR